MFPNERTTNNTKEASKQLLMGATHVNIKRCPFKHLCRGTCTEGQHGSRVNAEITLAGIVVYNCESKALCISTTPQIFK